MIERLDHLVLTVADIARTVDFYQRVLGMRSLAKAGVRWCLDSRNSICRQARSTCA